jgi:hypothetical protein
MPDTAPDTATGVLSGATLEAREALEAQQTPQVPQAPKPVPRSLVLFALIAAAVLMIVSSVLVSRNIEGLDDAFISYRFARNLAEGHGLVFNPGERVEGYTNLLYVLMIAPAFELGLEDVQIYDYSLALNLLASLALLVLITLYVRGRYGPRGAIVAVILLGACPTIWYWNASGMETPWVLLCQFALVVAADSFLRSGRRAALTLCVLASAVLILLRADGFVSSALIVLFFILRRRWKAALIFGVISAAVLLGVTLWRLHYYGFPFPNTYYAKVAGPLFTRLCFAVKRTLLLRNMWLAWIILVAYAIPVLWRMVRNKRTEELDPGLVLGLGIFAYSLYVGGDVLKERMLLFHIPYAIVILFALRLAPIHKMEWRKLALPLALLLHHAAVPDFDVSRLDRMLVWRGADRCRHPWSLLGEHLQRHEPGSTIATGAAGRIPFFSGLRTIDMLGLCDQHIAHGSVKGRFRVGHSKYDPDYVLDRDPDLIAETSDENGEMVWGMEGKWRERGYKPKYMCSRFVGGIPRKLPGIIDVTDRTDEEIRQLHFMGYNFLVVKKCTDPQ